MSASAPRIISVRESGEDQAVAAAAACLRAGGLAVIPTDTVYGLAADPAQPDAVARLVAVKGRDALKPIALLVVDADAARHYGATVPPHARVLANRFWPGALTLVLSVPSAGTADGTEGFRVPACNVTLALLRAVGGVLRVTSANRSGEPPATSAADAVAALGRDVDLVLDDGPSPGGVASTVVRITDHDLTVLREGALRETVLRAAMREGSQADGRIERGSAS